MLIFIVIKVDLPKRYSSKRTFWCLTAGKPKPGVQLMRKTGNEGGGGGERLGLGGGAFTSLNLYYGWLWFERRILYKIQHFFKPFFSFSRLKVILVKTHARQ